MIHCAECAFWDQPGCGHPHMGTNGLSDAGPFDPIRPHEDGLVGIGSDYERGDHEAEIQTGPRFGCILGESKKPAQEP